MFSRKALIWLALAALALILTGAGLGRWAYVSHQYARLLTQDADAIPAQPALLAFASRQAAPIYDHNCRRCHGADLKGDLRLGAPDLTDQDWLFGEGRSSEIEQTITHGVRSGDPKARNLSAMPAFAHAEPYDRYRIPPLKPGEIRDLVAYLLATEGRAAEPAAAARGGQIFHTNGGCYDCHGADAHGDGAIGAPNLTDNIWLYGDSSPKAIFDSIAGGRAGACPAWGERLKPGQIRALALFIFARAQPRASAKPRPS